MVTEMVNRNAGMKKFTCENRQCYANLQDNAKALIIQPVNEQEWEGVDELVDQLDCPCSYVAFQIKDWNKELSPWKSPAVFGKQEFGDGAGDTLFFIRESLLPEVRSQFQLEDMSVILGGYSLAGLFALWSCYVCDDFSAVAAVSPSVWFPGFVDFAKSGQPKCKAIYLSLGDREEKTKNQTMATVGDCIRELTSYYEDLCEQDGSLLKNSRLEWNPGNHFQDFSGRMARGYRWLME